MRPFPHPRPETTLFSFLLHACAGVSDHVVDLTWHRLINLSQHDADFCLSSEQMQRVKSKKVLGPGFRLFCSTIVHSPPVGESGSLLERIVTGRDQPLPRWSPPQHQRLLNAVRLDRLYLSPQFQNVILRNNLRPSRTTSTSTRFGVHSICWVRR